MISVVLLYLLGESLSVALLAPRRPRCDALATFQFEFYRPEYLALIFKSPDYM